MGVKSLCELLSSSIQSAGFERSPADHFSPTGSNSHVVGMEAPVEAPYTYLSNFSVLGETQVKLSVKLRLNYHHRQRYFSYGFNCTTERQRTFFWIDVHLLKYLYGSSKHQVVLLLQTSRSSEVLRLYIIN